MFVHVYTYIPKTCGLPKFCNDAAPCVRITVPVVEYRKSGNFRVEKLS